MVRPSLTISTSAGIPGMSSTLGAIFFTSCSDRHGRLLVDLEAVSLAHRRCGGRSAAAASTGLGVRGARGAAPSHSGGARPAPEVWSRPEAGAQLEENRLALAGDF